MDTPTAAPFEQLIFLIRGRKVMLSTDLARLYEVPTKVLVQAVKRNQERFPEDFMFQLSEGEAKILRSQSVTLGWGQYIKYAPYAFTEQGVAMLSSVLKSPRAVMVNIAIMRAFVKLRETLSLHKELAAKLQKVERDIYEHDAQIKTIFDVLKSLRQGALPPPRNIGFTPERRE